jgi:ComF family protein
MNGESLSRIRPRHGAPPWARWPGIGWRATLDLVFPAACVACGRKIDRELEPDFACGLCEDCVEQLELFAGPACRQCGAPVPGTVDLTEGCIRCRGRRLWFDETVALGEYAGRLRELLLEMKQARGNAVSLAVARLAWERCGDRLRSLEPDVVLAVPMHWRRRWSHGTNSAAVLAEVFAQRLRVRRRSQLLNRRRNTPPQFSLPPSKRWQNVRQAFSAKRSYSIQGAHVLLVDDIMTTGATCSEAAHTLKAAGADRVSVVVVARTLVH